jgi:peptidoglycan hydrolase-like protein with peptidoglycan-binding domain
MMFIYQAGMKGPETGRIQQRLIELGRLAGTTTDSFDDRTTAAVHEFQTAARLQADGRVGDGTWHALLGEPHAPCPGLMGADLLPRCIAVTGVFETSTPPPDCYAGVTGNFDGMGISFGVLQQNIGSKSLQPMLRRVKNEHPALIASIFGSTDGDEIAGIIRLDEKTAAGFERQMDWARGLNDQNNRITEPWRRNFRTLGGTPEYIAIQRDAAEELFNRALGACREFGLTSERAVAVLFDVMTQNGGIPIECARNIRDRLSGLPATPEGGPHEVAVLEIIAVERAKFSRPEFQDDVRSRKLSLAHGEGTVHGDFFDLDGQYGIGLRPATAPAVRRLPAQ